LTELVDILCQQIGDRNQNLLSKSEDRDSRSRAGSVISLNTFKIAGR